MHKHAHLPGRIDFRTATNPHGLRFAEGDGGAPAGAGGDGAGGDAGQPPAGGNGDGQGGDGQQGPPKPAPPKGQQGGQNGGDGQPDPQNVEDLPDWAQKIIRDTRGEAAGNRTKATQAEQRQQEIVKAFAKAAGIEIPGDDGDQPDPDKLTEQLTTTQQQARESAAELVVWRNAATLKVDASAVTDSRAFAKAIESLDPSSDTFAEDVKKAAEKAAENNPKLKAARAAGASSVDHAGGSGETPQRPTTLKDAVDAHYRAGR